MVTIIMDANKDQNELMPKDAQVIKAILKDLGINDYESRIVNQLLEFTYRYASSVLDDAHLVSQYGKKKSIDAEDIKLGIQLQVEKTYSSPPPREMLLEIARSKNSQSLPPIKSNVGTRLPPDRYSLVQSNYKLKPTNELKKPHQFQYN